MKDTYAVVGIAFYIISILAALCLGIHLEKVAYELGNENIPAFSLPKYDISFLVTVNGEDMIVTNQSQEKISCVIPANGSYIDGNFECNDLVHMIPFTLGKDVVGIKAVISKLYVRKSP